MKLSVSAYRAHASAHKKILSSSYQSTLNYGSTAASSSSNPANSLLSVSTQPFFHRACSRFFPKFHIFWCATQLIGLIHNSIYILALPYLLLLIFYNEITSDFMCFDVSLTITTNYPDSVNTNPNKNQNYQWMLFSNQINGNKHWFISTFTPSKSN